MLYWYNSFCLNFIPIVIFSFQGMQGAVVDVSFAHILDDIVIGMFKNNDFLS